MLNPEGLFKRKTPEEKQKRSADRLAKRCLSQFERGNYSIPARAGRLGVLNTFHRPEVYDLLATRLLEEDIEVKVDRVEQLIAFGTVTSLVAIADVVSIEKQAGWKKHLPKDPIACPQEYRGGNNLSLLALLSVYKTANLLSMENCPIERTDSEQLAAV